MPGRRRVPTLVLDHHFMRREPHSWGGPRWPAWASCDRCGARFDHHVRGEAPQDAALSLARRSPDRACDEDAAV